MYVYDIFICPNMMLIVAFATAGHKSENNLAKIKRFTWGITKGIGTLQAAAVFLCRCRCSTGPSRGNPRPCTKLKK
jgi:hypothetical protein